MAEQLYNNPTSIRPEYGWKPQGFLAGMNYDQDRRRYEDTASLQDYIMKNSAIESGVKLNDLFSDQPVRDAERVEKINKANVGLETYGPKQRGEVKKLNLENDLADGTFKSNVALKVAEAAIKGGQASTAQFEQMSQIGAMLSKAANGGPGSLAAVMQHLQKSGANPEILKFFGNLRDPKQIKAAATAINEGLLEASEKYQTQMRVQKQKDASDEKVAARHDATQVQIAELKKKDKIKDINQMLQDAVKLKPDQRASVYKLIMDDPEATLAQKQKALTGREEAIKAMNLGAKVDDPAIPGLPSGSPRRYGEGPGSGGDLPPGVQRLN